METKPALTIYRALVPLVILIVLLAINVSVFGDDGKFLFFME